MTFTYEELQSAYIKLKTYIYYDSSNLFLRKQLAIFETDLFDPGSGNQEKLAYVYFRKKYAIKHDAEDNIFERKLKDIANALNHHNEYPKFFETFLSKIKPQFVPKKLLATNEGSRIITNKRTANSYEASRTTIFIDLPIELHLISVLWILRKGYQLDRDLYDGCLGNRLILTKNKEAVVQGSALFKPYPKQYQKWRDDSVSVAREHLQNGENVMLLNLDIKDFFYSVRIPVSEINPDDQNKDDKALYTIFADIHVKFTDQIARKYESPYNFWDEVDDLFTDERMVILPIGLLSSFVLANNYLKDFDDRIIHKSKPIYYGRYVDDILMVIANPRVPAKVDGKVSDLNFSLDEYRNWLSKTDFESEEKNLTETPEAPLTDLELFILENFGKIICVVDAPSFLMSNIADIPVQRIFKLNGYPRLYCQSEKTLLHYFDSDESELVIDKLKKELEEKSSEFRNYDSADNEEDFEKSAYHLLYDGSSNKVRTLKDYKEDRFGIAVYLSKKIHTALKTGERISDKEAAKIVKLFKGSNALNFYSLWEKVFTYLLFHSKADEYVNFYINCSEAILRLSPVKGTITVDDTNYRESLMNHLDAAHELALSLQPDFLVGSTKARNTLLIYFKRVHHIHSFYEIRVKPTLEDSSYFARFRSSNLIRHHFVSQPLINYCLVNNGESFRFTHIPYNRYVQNPQKWKHSPRRIKYWEACVATFFELLGNFDREKRLDDQIESVYNYLDESHYLDRAFEVYQNINASHLSVTSVIKVKGKEAFFEYKSKPGNGNEPSKQEFHFKSQKKRLTPKIAVCNTIVKEENIKLSLRGTANTGLERIETLSKIFQQTKETNADILLFPECFVPAELLSTIISFAVTEQILTVTGLEHITVGSFSFNFIVTILPFEVEGIKDALIVYRLKNHYSHSEVLMVNTNHFKVPKPKSHLYQLFIWCGIYFSPYYCFEIADVFHRAIFKSKIDLMIACEWNQDVNYFSNIIESISRDLHAYVAQVNTSQYGDTRITRPTETIRKDILKLKGGLNDAILVGSIDIAKIREFQRELFVTTRDDKAFKPLPPDFNIEDVLKRINNKSII